MGNILALLQEMCNKAPREKDGWWNCVCEYM